MTKTIEELAKQYAKYQADEQGYGSMKEWKQDVAIYYDDAKSVLSWLFGKPLATRMTPEEKERVRKEYWQAARDWIGVGDARGYCKTCIALESIFGADFFKEGK